MSVKILIIDDDISIGNDVNKSFAPIDLECFSGIEKEWQERFRYEGFQLVYFGTDCGFATGKTDLFHKTVIDTLCRMALLFETFFPICQKAVLDEGNDLICHDGRDTFRCFTFPRNGSTFAVLGDGVPGDTQHFGDVTLTFASQVSFANFIVVFHCDYHRFFLRMQIFLHSE